jgi:phosphoribosylanthranilate isomerase
LADYKPDYLELGSAEIELLGDLPIPYILSTTAEAPKLASTRQPAFLLLKELTANPSSHRCLVEVQSYDQVRRAQEFSHFGGIALNGSPEIRPGLKEYDEMAEILEKLDID